MNDEVFKVILYRAKEFYDNIDKAHCRALNVLVEFNSYGFRHITHKSKRIKRPKKDILRRCYLLPKANFVIKNTEKVSDHQIFKGKEYWALEMCGLKVILRKVGNGNVHFYSIMD